MRYPPSTGPDLFIEFIKRYPVLHALQEQPLNQEGLGWRLDVSTATSYRLTGWLKKKRLIEESDDLFVLTAFGEVIEGVVSTFKNDLQTALRPTTATPDLLIDLIRYSPMLDALQRESLHRQQLEDQLDISRATSHRHTKSLTGLGLIERPEGAYTLTALGHEIADAASTFKTNARMALCLAPVLEAVYEITPDFDVGIFTDATVTTAEEGNAYSPMTRAISLFQQAETFRGFNTTSVAPTYLEEFHYRILNGMETEIIDPPEVAEDIMEEYPEKCVQVCVSEYFTHWLHDDLPFGLVLFDDHVGIGVRDSKAGGPRAFIDTDAPAALDWAEAVYCSYRSEAVLLERFTKPGLREATAAIEDGS